MSDLYLVLRSRLEAVTDWVTLGSDVMRAARKRKGLSYETVSRQLNVSSKTYERYEKDGRVPRLLLIKLADVLELEIEEPMPQRLSVRLSETEEEGLGRVESLLEEILGLVRELRGHEAGEAAAVEG